MAEIIDLTDLTDSSDQGGFNEEGESSSEQSENEDSAPAASNVQLVIARAPEDRLRTVIARLAARIPAVERALVQELAAGHSSSMAGGRTRQTVTRRLVTCTCCGEAFDANSEERDERECYFHPGKLRVDEASFVDWDEDRRGLMDTRSNRRDYPENFLWTCCRKDGMSEGCVTGEHTEFGGDRKRRRV